MSRLAHQGGGRSGGLRLSLAISRVQRELAECDAAAGVDVDLTVILDGPAGGGEQPVDLDAGQFLGARHVRWVT
jgi:hypothetical protein